MRSDQSVKVKRTSSHLSDEAKLIARSVYVQFSGHSSACQIFCVCVILMMLHPTSSAFADTFFTDRIHEKGESLNVLETSILQPPNLSRGQLEQFQADRKKVGVSGLCICRIGNESVQELA